MRAIPAGPRETFCYAACSVGIPSRKNKAKVEGKKRQETATGHEESMRWTKWTKWTRWTKGRERTLLIVRLPPWFFGTLHALFKGKQAVGPEARHTRTPLKGPSADLQSLQRREGTPKCYPQQKPS